MLVCFVYRKPECGGQYPTRNQAGTVAVEAPTILAFDMNWAVPPITLIDLVRSRSSEAEPWSLCAASFHCPYLTLSASLVNRTSTSVVSSIN